MDKLIPALNTLLSTDEDLLELVSSVRYWRAPREPKSLIKPLVVFRILNFADKPGTHGLISTPFIEIHIWGYDKEDAQIIQATRAANRIANLLTTKRIVVPGGGSTRITVLAGFDNRDELDPNIIHFVGRFATDYISPSRVIEATS